MEFHLNRLVTLGLSACLWAPALAAPKDADKGQEMRVEEPKASTKGAIPPIDPERDQDGWDLPRGGQSELSPEQKKAAEERKRKMLEMMAQIREKRHAIADAKGEEKAELSQELQQLILDKDASGEDRKLGGDPELKAAQQQRQADIQEQVQEKRQEMQQKKAEKAQENLEKKIQKLQEDPATVPDNGGPGNGNGNGNGNANGNGNGNANGQGNGNGNGGGQGNGHTK